MLTKSILKLFLIFHIFTSLKLSSSENCESQYEYIRLGRQSRKSSLFQIKNQDHTADVNLAFEIPFFQIPVKRSITGIQSMTSEFMKGNALGILNFPAFIINIIGIVGGIFLAGIDKTSQNGLMDNLNIFKFLKRNRFDDHQNSVLEDGMYMFEKTFRNYNVDSKACAQRLVCWLVKKANKNVVQGDSNKIDRIIEDLSKSTWSMELIEGTDFENAVIMGRNMNNCEKAYRSCSFK